MISYCSSSNFLSPCISHLPRAFSFFRVGGVGQGGAGRRALLRKAVAFILLVSPFLLPRKPVVLGMGWENSGEPEGVFSLEVYQDAGSIDVSIAQDIFVVLTLTGPDLICQHAVQLTRLLTGTCVGAYFRLTSIQVPIIFFLSSHERSSPKTRKQPILGELCCIV